MEGKRVDPKLMLFTLVLVLIALLLLNWFFNNNREDDIWDYDNIESATQILYFGERIEDRQVYYNLEQIVANYLYSYTDDYSSKLDEQKLSYEEYYEYLSKNYKKHLSKKKYTEKADAFLKKFYVNATSEYETMNYMDTEQIIKEIYSFDNSVYLCKLRSSFTGKTGYLGVQMDTVNGKYNIMYIE